jgi:cystathionine beta-lyase family protein involved in aluminum resistance
LSFADYAAFGISRKTFDLSEQALTTVAPAFATFAQIRGTNQLRVIGALQRARLSESMLGGSTGYGYDDAGRDQIEKAFALAFGAEAALVRIQISSGTQALAICLFGLLRPGDELLSVSGPPYDTLSQTIGALADFGIRYRQVDLTQTGEPDPTAIREALNPSTKVVFIQKSRGYTQRRALCSADLQVIVQTVRQAGSAAAILVDNCYGEFVETVEPCMVGADLVAGSLIKNPGGGLCPSGGYIAGRTVLVNQVAARLNAPGLGGHVGPTLGFSRLIAQGLYMAPQVVTASLQGASFAAAFFQAADCKASPGPLDHRGDIVQTLEFGDSRRLIAFCQSIQAASPVDSYVTPEPRDMPGSIAR